MPTVLDRLQEQPQSEIESHSGPAFAPLQIVAEMGE